MTMGWFIPLGLLIGLLGTQTATRVRHSQKANRQNRGWWLLLLLSWLPAFCWIMAQFVAQG